MGNNQTSLSSSFNRSYKPYQSKIESIVSNSKITSCSSSNIKKVKNVEERINNFKLLTTHFEYKGNSHNEDVYLINSYSNWSKLTKMKFSEERNLYICEAVSNNNINYY